MSAAPVRQHVILCEGYDDRSFWAGWLTALDCTDPTNGGETTGYDAWGRAVKGRGRYLYETPRGSKIIIQPYGGKSRAQEAVREYLRGEVHRPDRLILNLDADTEAGSDDAGQPGPDRYHQILRDYGVEQPHGAGPFEIDGTTVSAVIWTCDDPHPTPGVPAEQTLERLVAAAIRAADQARGPAVDAWLAAEPRGERTGPKSYGYSYLAKWYAEHGADDFYRALWRDPAVAGELRRRLEAAGAWATVSELVEA